MVSISGFFIFPWQSVCAFCLAVFISVEELISLPLYSTVLFSTFPNNDNLSSLSIDLDSPTLHWMITFHMVSIPLFPVWIVVVRSFCPTIVSHE